MKWMLHRWFIRFSAVALLVGGIGFTGCSVSYQAGSAFNSNPGVESIRTQTGNISADIKVVDLENQLGDIHIVAVDQEPAGWSWTLKATAESETLARQTAAAAVLQVEQNAFHLHLGLSMPQGTGAKSYQSNWELRVPKSVRIQTRNSFGRIVIAGISGAVEAHNENGLIDLRDIEGKVQANTSFATLTAKNIGAAELKNQNGLIEAQNIKGPLIVRTSFASITAHDVDGTLSARNQNGRIEAWRINGNTDLGTSFAELTADTIQGNTILKNQNGSITVRGVTGSVRADTSFARMEIEGANREINCHNQNGSIQVQTTSMDVTSVEAETSFASLEVHLPSGLKPAVQAQTSFAKIESDFPVLMKPEGQNPFEGIDASTPRIRLHNQNGSIRVLGQKSVAAGTR